MLFNSGVFLQFFAAFLLLYWLVRNHLPARNLLIVAASYLFYGWWNWRLLGLLAFSSVFDYAVGRALAMLNLSPQALQQRREQVQVGNVKSIEEVRRELRPSPGG